MRKHSKSAVKVLLATIVLVAGMSVTTWAADWKQDTTGWQYEQDGGGYAIGWQWIDGKCYYFADNGYMLANTEVDGYTLNEYGQWTVDGVVQIQGVETGAVNTDIPTEYNENGISNIAIDLLEHTRAENAAKYGEARVEEMAGEYDVFYSNTNFIVNYQYSDPDSKPSYVQSFGNQADQIFKIAPMTGKARSDKEELRANGYSAVTDDIMTVVDCGKYECQLSGSSKFAKVYIKFDYTY